MMTIKNVFILYIYFDDIIDTPIIKYSKLAF